MDNEVILNKGKKDLLIELLSRVDRRNKYYFFITTCYFKMHSADTLIRELANVVGLHGVEIYLDRNEAAKIGKQELLDWLSSINKRYDFDVSLHPVKSGSLFHAKSYSLISWNGDEIEKGCLVAGSANLTGAGLTSDRGNVEVFVYTNEIKTIDSFYNAMCNFKYQSLDDLEVFSSVNSFDFKYSFLNAGYFIHTWEDSLNQELSIKYQLSKEGKKKINSLSPLDELGFNLTQSTVSKSYFDYNFERPLTEYEKNIKRNFGVATFLGHWVPKSVIHEVLGDDDFEQFKNDFLNKLDDEIEEVIVRISEDYSQLEELELIELGDKDPVERFKENINKLRNNDIKLWRIYSKYEIFELPYDFSQMDNIKDLYDNFTATYQSKKSNKTVKAIYHVLEKKSLDPILNMSTINH